MESNETTWSEDFRIGVPKIDKKFYNLFSVLDDINEFRHSSRIDYDSKLRRVLSRLDKFSQDIATFDNDLVQTEDTADIDQYVVNSQKLLTKVDDFILHFNSNNRLLLDEIIDYLKKWLMVQLLQAEKVFVRN